MKELTTTKEVDGQEVRKKQVMFEDGEIQTEITTEDCAGRRKVRQESRPASGPREGFLF